MVRPIKIETIESCIVDCVAGLQDIIDMLVANERESGRTWSMFRLQALGAEIAAALRRYREEQDPARRDG